MYELESISDNIGFSRYGEPMSWNVEVKYIKDWLDQLDGLTIAHIAEAIKALEDKGPSLGRPLVDSLRHTTIANLKELRPASPGNSEIRILFAFDPQRKAILLLGGDKSKGKSGASKWSGWYRKAIPKAEAIYSKHLINLE